jgi:preprotein translocase subunit SecF
MQLLGHTKIDFMRKRLVGAVFSCILISVSVIALVTQGLNFGIDFTGGTLIELGYNAPANLEEIRTQLESGGFSESVVQNFGSARDVLVRIPSRDGADSAEVSTAVLKSLPGAEMRRVEFVGPQVGEDLTEKGGLAILYALIGILIYVWLRFEWQYAVGSVAALVHDVVIVVGGFSVLQLNFDLPVLAAVLAVIGYSLNDTIVVFDRIRENFRKLRKQAPIDVVNISLNETLARTVMTSLTTLLVLFALFFLGGETIHSFAAALIMGVFIGTYSSLFVASPTALSLGITRADLMPVIKEGADNGP